MTLVHCGKCHKNIPLMEIDSNWHDAGYCVLTDEDKKWNKIGYVSTSLMILSVCIMAYSIPIFFKEYHEMALIYGVLLGLPFLFLSCFIQFGALDSLFKGKFWEGTTKLTDGEGKK